jgi:hypothetical protein
MEGRTKKERREAARRERERILKQQARRRQLQRLTAIGIGAVIVVVVLALFLLKPGSSDETSNASESLPGIQTGPPPWPPELAHLRQRLQRLGLPAQPSMAANLHHHDLLQIFDHGDPVTVPESIGIDPTAGFLTSIHTHDSSGIIHVESPTQRSFNLGEFFDVWGLRLTSTCIGGLCDSGEDQLRAFVDGKPWTSSPREIPLKQHEDIVLTYGTEAEQPSPIPSDYSKSISKTCAPDC